MFWADRIAKEIEATRKPKNGSTFVIRDEKTLSGRVHIGSMRGLAIHSLVGEVLSEYGHKTTFLWEHNDIDPFDSIPPFLDETVYREHLGKPLYLVPSPEAGYANYAEYFGAEFVRVHEKYGATPDYYWAGKDLYGSGKMDEYMRKALERSADVRRILKEVSGSQKDENWLPVSVICEKCNKIMTTRAYDFDGETVAYSCERSPDGCEPCGHTGRRSPFSGGAKLFWKVEWAGKWGAMGVDIEGGGKDHSTKGGARDVANHIAQEIFDVEPPFDIPYEFFLVGGKKMSSSKGSGSTAHDMSQLFPTPEFRLVLIGKEFNQQIDIDQSGDSIPRLYDWYDELGEGVRNGTADDFSRLYELCQPLSERAGASAPWMLRFSQVAFIAQMPHINLLDEATSVKGAPLSSEEEVLLEERRKYAKYWLANYADDSYKYVLQESMPDIELLAEQKRALGLLSTYMSEARSGEEIHARLHELKTEADIAPKELFSAIYRVFLNRESGPKAGWFLSVLPQEFVQKRLQEASA